MSVVLVTGASGFIGSHLLPRLSVEHDVIALSRREVAGDCASIRGDFASRAALQALDSHRIATVVHLAAEIGGCSEEAGLKTNVLGTQTLLRYLVDRGCKHFVLASSIAAVGCGSEDFIPQQLPIPDDHPCDVTDDAYGLSKALMEEVAFYFHRRHPELEITVFRLGAVLAPDAREDFGQWEWLADTTYPFVIGGGVIALPDVIDAFALAVRRRLGPGIRRLNLVGATSRTQTPVPEALGSALGERASALDMEYYRAEGREMASLYSIDRLWDSYEFRPSIDVRTEDPATGFPAAEGRPLARGTR